MKKLGAFLAAACAAVVGFSYTSETLPNGDTLLSFTTAGDEVWSPTRDYERVTVLIVGGGGAGGYGCGAGGGGGGEVIILSNQTFFAGQDYAVKVGAGGQPSSNTRYGGDGGASSFGDYVAPGGGGGGGHADSSTTCSPGREGANGGGGACNGNGAGGAGTGKSSAESEGDVYYFGGFSGASAARTDWLSGGGGGAMGAGTRGVNVSGDPDVTRRGGKGGDGLALDITGEVVYYACGGGGGVNGDLANGVLGGDGGSGNASGGHAADGSGVATAGMANTGTGGGAGAYSKEKATGLGAQGGSGVVYVRIPGDQPVRKVKGYAKSFTFSVCGYKGAAALEDFQLLVRIKEGDGGFSYADLQSDDGRDIRFSLPDDTLLEHEIDTFDPTGTSCFWVKVPELTNGLELKMHWGKADDYKLNAKEVFAGYVGVYHLGEAEGSFADSSPCDVAATRKTNGGNTPFVSAGRIGRSTFITDSKVDNNASHGGIYVPSTGIVQLPSSTAFTLSGWFRPNGAVSSKDEGLFMNNGTTFIVRRYWNGGDNIYCGTTSMTAANIFNGTKSQWFHLIFVYDGEACKVYKNGTLVKTVSGSPELKTALAVGCRYNGNGDMSFHGQVDEVRICGEQLSADRIQAEYDQSVTTQKFLSFYDVDHVYVVPPDTVGATLGTPPYDSWETAATNIADAVAANTDQLDVRIAPGRYPITERLVLNNPGVTYACVDKTTGAPVYGGAVIDAGGRMWDKSAVSLSGASMRGFMIVNATNTTNGAMGGGLYVAADSDPAHFVSDTVISNCCLTGSSKPSGGGIYLVKEFRGIVSNCLIVANSAPVGGGLYFYYANAAALESHPTVIDTTFDSNVMSGDWGTGGAAYVAGIAFNRCTFTRNARGASGLSSYSPCIHSAGYVQILGCWFVANKSHSANVNGSSCIYGASVVRNSRFVRNESDVYFGSGELENCVATNNYGRGVAGLPNLRNCLIANNGGVGVYYVTAGESLIENTTIANNDNYGIYGYAGGDLGSRAVLVNSIVSGNKTHDYMSSKADDCVVSNSVVTVLTKSGHDASQDQNRYTYTAAQVKFTDAANGDYTLKRRSPCRDQGIKLGWMTDDATDLAGNPRVFGDLPDLGCYENCTPAPGLMLLLR